MKAQGAHVLLLLLAPVLRRGLRALAPSQCSKVKVAHSQRSGVHLYLAALAGCQGPRDACGAAQRAPPSPSVLRCGLRALPPSQCSNVEFHSPPLFAAWTSTLLHWLNARAGMMRPARALLPSVLPACPQRCRPGARRAPCAGALLHRHASGAAPTPCCTIAHVLRLRLRLHSPKQVEKAPLESYADVGGLEQQIQEIKEVRGMACTHNVAAGACA